MPASLPRPARWTVVLGLVALTGCSSGATPDQAGSGGPLTAVTSRPSTAPAVPTASPAVPAAAPDQGRAPVEVPVAELAQRLRPDVLVTAAQPLALDAVARLAGLSPAGGALSYRAGSVQVGGTDVAAVGVDPSTFRAFAAEGTAEATGVWQSVARGEAVASHQAATALGLVLGEDVVITTPAGPVPLRLGAFASTGVPGSDLVVDDATARALGLQESRAVLLSATEGADPVALAAAARTQPRAAAAVDLLSAPAEAPVAFLTGSKAAKAFGAFSYRYFADGTIQPDEAWVEANIRTETLPIMGRVTCHRLMLTQLRGALQDVVDAGLAPSLTTYDGCYVPRFIERNPDNSISLHTWGIAIDMDASTNYRGIRGTMDPQVVEIFKRWGFRWGGDWAYTDPMHFELGALLDTPR